jgi:hypothetical protein
MIALLLTSLFVAAALLAGGTLVNGFKGIMAEAAQARAALAACPRTNTAEYRISEVKVLRAPAKVLVLPVRQAGWRQGGHLPQPDLRAAA